VTTTDTQDQPALGAFGIFDILGFRHRLKSMPLTALRDRVVGALVSAAHSAEQIVNRDLSRASFSAMEKLRWACFSDTVILWLPTGKRTPSDTVESLVYTSQLLLARTMWLKVPLRGAIAYGECVVSQDPVYYLGKPVLEAYDMEKAQEWAGAVLAQSASGQLDSGCSRTVTYDVPTKTGMQSLRAVDWPFCSDGPRCKRFNGTSEAPGPSPDWSACFNNSGEHGVLEKKEATRTFFEVRDKAASGGGVIFGEDSGDISSWRDIYNGYNPTKL